MTAFAPGAGPPEKMIPTRRMSLAAMAPPPTGYLGRLRDRVPQITFQG